MVFVPVTVVGVVDVDVDVHVAKGFLAHTQL